MTRPYGYEEGYQDGYEAAEIKLQAELELAEAYLAAIFNIVDTPVQNATGLSHLKEIRQVFRRRAALQETSDE